MFCNKIETNYNFASEGDRVVFFDFRITSGIWLYISAVLLTSACAHLFVNHLAESSHYVNQCNMKRFLLKHRLLVHG